MPLQEEVLLMILVIGLYLYDSTMLLYCNEGVLVPAGKGWAVRFGFREPKIRGKELFIPAPWLLHRPMFRLAWQFDGGSPQSEKVDWQALRAVPLPMIALVWIIALALFLLLPLGFFTTLGHGMLLAAVVVIYPGIVSMLLYMWLHRDRMSLTKKQVGKFAFEFLTCPPFALNVVRTISSSRTIGEDLVTAARRLQDPQRWAATREQLTLRLDEEIEIEDEGSERMAKLQAHRLKLAE
jgi:hypothetical protein